VVGKGVFEVERQGKSFNRQVGKRKMGEEKVLEG
jgi:hypothetical protein